MESVRLNNNQVYKINLVICVVLLLYLGLHLFLLNRLANATYLILGVNLFLGFTFLSYFTFKEFKVFLLLVNLLPLFYVSISLHYLIKNIIFQDLPLHLFFLLSFFYSLRSTKWISIKFNYLSSPLLYLLFLGITLVVIGTTLGHKKLYVLDEFYHLLYYPFGLIIFSMIKERRHYYLLIKFLIIFVLFFSIENIYMNLFTGIIRFVTFQSYISPLAIGILFAYILLNYNKKSLKWLVVATLLLITTLGMFVTMTRSLWITIFITFSSIMFIYLLKIKKIRFYKLLLSGLLLSLPLIWLISSQKTVATKKENYYDIEYRTSSLANPAEDASFLMRMEIGYYAIKRFLDSPLWGKGFGDSVQYRFMTNLRNDIIYPDNSWLFFLWKGGIIGLFLFVFFYYRWIKALLFIFDNTDNLTTKIITLGIIGGLGGLIVFGLFNAILIKYKTLSFISILIGYTIFEFSYLQKKNHPNTYEVENEK